MYWRQHSLNRHSSILNPTNRLRSTGDSEDPLVMEEERLPEDDMPLAVSDDVSLKEWVTVCYDKSYTPTAEDVGCILRIEVKSVAISDGTVLAGPVVVITEPVLSAPRAPPKRPLLTVAGSTSGGGARFRVLSYNILAELYATKQVIL